MTPTNKQPLFIITGASCVGKSTMCEKLFKKETDYIVIESDLLWNNIFDTPDNGYCEYRRLWMRLCANISQIGIPAVLCGCAIPAQFEQQPERDYFTNIHYLAVVCNDECLEKRLHESRKIEDKNWLMSSLQFNNWLKENANKTVPKISLLDNSNLSAEQAAAVADAWIKRRMNIL